MKINKGLKSASTSKTSKSRREFLKNTSLAVGATMGSGLLSSCSYLDHLVMGDLENKNISVVVLGAGLAGLSAALELKKSKIPFKLFESQAKFGGRVMTLKNWHQGQSVELGGEFIKPTHTEVIALCKELRLNLNQLKINPKYYFSDKFVTPPEWNRFYTQFNKLVQKQIELIYGNKIDYLTALNHREYPMAVELDQISVYQWFEKNSFAPWTQYLARRWCEYHYGMDSHYISALSFMHFWRENKSFFPESQLQVSGGNILLLEALFERISGLVPDKIVKLKHRLVAVERKEKGFRLTFDLDGQTVQQDTQYVICALPFSALREVDGIDNIGFGRNKNQLIREMNYGFHSKIVYGFNKYFWKDLKQRSFDSVVTSLETQNFFSYQSTSPLFRNKNAPVLTSLLGGEAGLKGGTHSVDQGLRDLANLSGDYKVDMQNSYVHNWTRTGSYKGSVSFMSQGQFYRFGHVASQPECGGLWQFAGEHTSQNFQGTMNGAVASASDAVRNLLVVQKQII